MHGSVGAGGSVGRGMIKGSSVVVVVVVVVPVVVVVVAGGHLGVDFMGGAKVDGCQP